MSTIQVRTDAKLKKKVQKILKEMGLDLSGAINLYLHHIAIAEGIPFSIRTENGFTIEQELQMLQESEEAMESSKEYASAKELHKDILGKDY